MKRALLFLIGMCATMSTAMGGKLPDFDAKWDYDKPAETEAVFRIFLSQTEKSGNLSYVTELQTQIARTLGLQQKFSEAHALLDSVESVLEQVNDRARVRYLLERGRVYNSSREPARALPLFKEAYELGVKGWLDYHAVDAAHMAAIAASGSEREQWTEKAIELAEKSLDPKARKWLGSLYNNQGWDLFDRKQYDSALAVFENALRIRREFKQLQQEQIARWCIAKTLRMLGKTERAMEMQKQLEKEYARTRTEPDGYVFEEIGECLLALNRPDEAAPYFAKAYTYLSKNIWLTRDQPARLERLKKLGEIEK